jgi:hypothetical protein
MVSMEHIYLAGTVIGGIGLVGAIAVPTATITTAAAFYSWCGYGAANSALGLGCGYKLLKSIF